MHIFILCTSNRKIYPSLAHLAIAEIKLFFSNFPPSCIFFFSSFFLFYYFALTQILRRFFCGLKYSRVLAFFSFYTLTLRTHTNTFLQAELWCVTSAKNKITQNALRLDFVSLVIKIVIFHSLLGNFSEKVAGKKGAGKTSVKYCEEFITIFFVDF